MKKIVAIILMIVCWGMQSVPVSAGGGLGILTLSTNKTSAVADGADGIIVTVRLFHYACSVPPFPARPEEKFVVIDPDECARQGLGEAILTPNVNAPLLEDGYPNNAIYVGGSGNSFSPADYNSLRTDSQGYVSFTLKSTTAEVKIISSTYSDYSRVSKEVAFVSPINTAPSAASSTSTSAKTTQKTATSITAPVDTKPASPILSTLGDAKTPEDKIFTNSIYVGDPITLSGIATPNATVKLTIYSDPITTEVKADATGAWTYTIADLPVGDHRVEAQLIDSAGAVSDNVEIAKFSVSEKVAPAGVPNTSKAELFNGSVFTLANYILAAVLVLLIVGAIIYRKKKKLHVETI